jgi:hypothetical protein
MPSLLFMMFMFMYGMSVQFHIRWNILYSCTHIRMNNMFALFFELFQGTTKQKLTWSVIFLLLLCPHIDMYYPNIFFTRDLKWSEPYFVFAPLTFFSLCSTKWTKLSSLCYLHNVVMHRAGCTWSNKNHFTCVKISVGEPWHFGADPDPDPRIRTSD